MVNEKFVPTKVKPDCFPGHHKHANVSPTFCPSWWLCVCVCGLWQGWQRISEPCCGCSAQYWWCLISKAHFFRWITVRAPNYEERECPKELSLVELRWAIKSPRICTLLSSSWGSTDPKHVKYRHLQLLPIFHQQLHCCGNSFRTRT